MLFKLKHVIFLCAAILILLFTSFITSYAGSVKYAYDDLNRVINVFNDDGKYIEYAYDEVGNRTEKTSLIDMDAPVSVAIPASRGFTTTISVALSCTDGSGSGCDKIYYTTDGTTPNTSSPVYTSSLTIENTTTLKFFAIDRAGHAESPNTETYTYDITPPVTTALPLGGNIASTVSVTLTCNDGSGSGCDKIYYTTDNSKPTTASTVYTAPIQISETTKLKFFATDLAANQETFQTQVYITDLPPLKKRTMAYNDLYLLSFSL
ncbi:MAG: chitobiase/beta-hexosaminidase C-terminal domain-containing protein [Proteobacteria bacterium]|nr:chitobiase/beta-hexosaminidase C-terminal domain-containing protein [Pseudomonadota bacterium]